MNRRVPFLALGLLLALDAAHAAPASLVIAPRAEAALLDANAVDALVLTRGPELVEARLRLALDDLDIELERRPDAPMLEWRLVPGGLDLESMLLQPIRALLTRDLRAREANVARERARIEYAAMALDALVAGRGEWHAAIVAERRLALARERAGIAEARLRWRQARQSVGEDDATAVLEAQAAARSAAAEMEGAEATAGRRRAALAERLGLADAGALALPDNLPLVLSPWPDDAASGSGAAPDAGPLPIRLARIERQAADVESLLRHHAGATWMPALGLETGAMDTALRIGVSPPAWGRGRLARARADTARELATRRLDHAQRRQGLALAAAVRTLDARRRAEADRAGMVDTTLHGAALATARQSRGEAGPDAIWRAREARVAAELAKWDAREATLASALDVVLALAGRAAGEATEPQPPQPPQQTDGR
jgi:hypothetical protein